MGHLVVEPCLSHIFLSSQTLGDCRTGDRCIRAQRSRRSDYLAGVAINGIRTAGVLRR